MTSSNAFRALLGDGQAWILEKDGVAILRVSNPRQIDMFWCSFKEEQIGDTIADLDEAFWNSVAPPVYLWRHETSGCISPNAFVAATPYDLDGRLLVRGLRLPPKQGLLKNLIARLGFCRTP